MYTPQCSGSRLADASLLAHHEWTGLSLRKLGRDVEFFHGGIARPGTLRSQRPSPATEVLAIDSGYRRRGGGRRPFEEGGLAGHGNEKE